MPNGTYGGVRGKETKVGQKTFVSRPTRLFAVAGIYQIDGMVNTCDVSAYSLKDKDILLSTPG